MEATLTQPCRVSEKVSNCKALSGVKMMTVTPEEAPANFVPAAAVIRRGERCSELLGVKGV